LKMPKFCLVQDSILNITTIWICSVKANWVAIVAHDTIDAASQYRDLG